MFIKRIGAFFLDILEVLVFSVVIFLFFYLLILQPHKIKGSSMEPNFHNGEYLLTDKVTYRFSEPKRGDVVVFKAPGTINDEYIKRIIALPNERVMIKEGNVYINGTHLEENYLPTDLKTYPGIFLKEGTEILVPQNQFFVLGDNRVASSDSRIWGFVDKNTITGRAWIIYWPISKIGSIQKVSYNF